MADLGAAGVLGKWPGYIKGSVIGGVVTDDNGDGCERALYLMNRPSDASVRLVEAQRTASNANTGAYTFPVASAQLTGYVEHNVVICFDDDAGTDYNAMILDNVTPA